MLYRIKFEKTGLAKYISHLDLNRQFMRAINRAGIDIAYSEGFNPHQKITFASTLSLGVCSYCEFLDIKTGDNETAENIFNGLSKTMPNAINIKEVYVPDNAFKNISSTRYHIFIKFEQTDTNCLRKMFSEDITVEKKSKTKTVTTVINGYIDSIDFYDSDGGYTKIDTVVKTGNDLYLNPEYIVKAIDDRFKIDDYFIEKLDMFDGKGAKFA